MKEEILEFKKDVKEDMNIIKEILKGKFILHNLILRKIFDKLMKKSNNKYK